jgi:serine/threonine-protein kinase
VSGLEFLQRVDRGQGPLDERWLVQVPGQDKPHLACFLHDDDRDQLAEVERLTRPWLGPIHPRIAAIHAIRWHGERLVVEIEDDRGPWFVKAAAQLADPIERERWAIAQIIGIADGLATMRQRDRAFVHRRLEPSQIGIDVGGHARLRAPIALVEAGPRPGRMGAGVIRALPAFMAPEQVRGHAAVPQTDVFALACHLYQALAGRPPFRRESEFDTLHAIITEPHAPVTTHAPDLQRVLDFALAKDLAARYPDVGTFAGELWQCAPDAMEYDAVISDRIVAWRASAEITRRAPVFATSPCRMQWEQLGPTGSADVRHCNSCREDVVRVSSLAQIVPLAGRCVSYTGGD